MVLFLWVFSYRRGASKLFWSCLNSLKPSIMLLTFILRDSSNSFTAVSRAGRGELPPSQWPSVSPSLHSFSTSTVHATPSHILHNHAPLVFCPCSHQLHHSQLLEPIKVFILPVRYMPPSLLISHEITTIFLSFPSLLNFFWYNLLSYFSHSLINPWQ